MKKSILLFSLLILFSCSNDNDNKETLLITSINPSTGPKNTPVTIIGSGFSNVSSENVVTINGKVCPVINSTATQLTITIPPSAGSGKIKVEAAGADAESSNFEFVITTTVTTIAGSSQGLNDGQGFAAQFNFLRGITLDTQGNLLIADGDRIRKVSSNGLVTTIAGSTGGFLDGQGILAKFDGVTGIVITATGAIHVTERFNHKIRVINNTGIVSNFAGTIRGFSDGNRFFAAFNIPNGIVIDASGNTFVADSFNRRIRKIAGDNVTTFSGNSNSASTDGQGVSASFEFPRGLSIDNSGNLYVTDDFILIRKITPTGLVTTIAGSTSGFADGQGTAARFNNATGIVADSEGNLFVTDGSKIRKITSNGLVTTLAGTATKGFVDGNADIAQFNNLDGITIDSQGNLYVADTGNFKIRKITFD